jgi:hypothetical protein
MISVSVKYQSYPDHGRYGDLPLQGKIPTVEPGIEPGTSCLVARSCDHQATRPVVLCLYIALHRVTSKESFSTKQPGKREILFWLSILTALESEEFISNVHMFEFMHKIVTIMRPTCKLTSNKWNIVLALHNGKSFYFPIALWRGHFVYKLRTCRVVFLCLFAVFFCNISFPILLIRSYWC